MLKQINKYVDKNFIDVVLANKKIVPDNVLKFYQNEKSSQIMIDRENIQAMGV